MSSKPSTKREQQKEIISAGSDLRKKRTITKFGDDVDAAFAPGAPKKRVDASRFDIDALIADAENDEEASLDMQATQVIPEDDLNTALYVPDDGSFPFSAEPISDSLGPFNYLNYDFMDEEIKKTMPTELRCIALGTCVTDRVKRDVWWCIVTDWKRSVNGKPESNTVIKIAKRPDPDFVAKYKTRQQSYGSSPYKRSNE